MSISEGSTARDHGVDDVEDDDIPPALPVGFVVGGKYKIKRVLGAGGNGAVYEGEHTEVGHRVAIKISHRKQDDRGDIMVRFRREARICGSLRHPHVGQVFDVGMLDAGEPYMVMELQEGRSLADVIDETTLPIAAIIDITRQLLAGLSAAHQAGTVHLDVKPDNVMLVRDHGGDVVVKLVDFGISQRLNEVEAESDDDERMVVGSPDYMPPEQLRGQRVDQRTDLYAAGVLLYEAITRQTPFDAATTEDLVLAIMGDEVPAPTVLRPECPIELERVVMKAMARNPAERFQSADDMSRALAALRINAGARNTAPTNLVTFSEPTPPAESLPAPRPTSNIRRRRTIDARTLQTVRVRVKSKQPRPLSEPQVVAPAAPTARDDNTQRVKIRPPAGPERDLRPFAIGIGLLVVLVTGWIVTRHGASGATDAAAPGSTSSVAAPPAQAAAPSHPPPAAAAPTPAPAQPATANAAVDDDEREPANGSREPSSSAARARAARMRAARAAEARAEARAAEARPAARAPEPEPQPVRAAEPPPAPVQDPTLTRTQLRAAQATFNSGKVEEALKLYRALVKVAPNEANAWRGLAVTANRMAERAEAERALRRYLTLRPHATDAGKILQRVGGGP